MLNKIGVNACVLGPSLKSLNLSQHVDVEQDRGTANACALRLSLNLSQHIHVKQDGKGKPLCSGAFSESPAAHRC